MKRLQFRQGDVLLLQCDAIPSGAKHAKNRDRIVLANGEATGHAHAISTRYAQEYALANDRYLKITNFTNLVHEEHGPIMVPPGFYRVIRQREYMPESFSYVDD